MDGRIDVQPLSYRTRQRTFGFLFLIFLVSLPFLYLYATGYRLDFERPTNLISTGGMYIAVDGTGAEIYIDDELVRETRTFRKAFYAQNLDIGTHRVHVQKPGYHTWVKELPVSKHRVTEAEAFNLPLIPQVRVIGEWQTATGTVIIPSLITSASATNPMLLSTSTATSTFVRNTEYQTLMTHFGTSSEELEEASRPTLRDLLTNATTTEEESEHDTLVSSGVRLYRSGDELFARWIGSFEQMPYYYCAPEFPPYSSSAPPTIDLIADEETEDEELLLEGEEVIHPVQTVPKDVECNPTIQIDRKGQLISDFEFFPGSTDFVLLVLEDGIYVVEIDDRAWQNVQPLLLGSNLRMHIENGNIYVYDGTLIYQVIIPTE